jgi:hypothetical protein
MTKPEIKPMKPDDILLRAINNAKDKSVVSCWWLSIPLYIVAMLLRKSFYMPGTSLISHIHDLARNEKYIYLIFFLLSPVVLIIANAFSIRKIYSLSENPGSWHFLKKLWFNILIIGLSVALLLLYLL